MPSELYKLRQFIVKKFVKPEKIIWSGQMKITHDLIKFNDNPKFWEFLNLGFMLNNLAWFKTSRGMETLNKALLLFSYVPPLESEKYKISDKKFGEDLIVNKKKSTIMDILN